MQWHITESIGGKINSGCTRTLMLIRAPFPLKRFHGWFRASVWICSNSLFFHCLSTGQLVPNWFQESTNLTTGARAQNWWCSGSYGWGYSPKTRSTSHTIAFHTDIMIWLGPVCLRKSKLVLGWNQFSPGSGTCTEWTPGTSRWKRVERVLLWCVAS